MGLTWFNYPQTAYSLGVAPYFKSSESYNTGEMKKCSKCGELKDLSEFGKDNKFKNGLNCVCKKCRCEIVKKYNRTKDGLVTQIYADQKKASIVRGHNPPSYSKLELKEWLFSQKLFHTLFNDWVNSNYIKVLVPSCDRINNNIGYSFANIQLVTWGKNQSNAWRDMRNCLIIHGVRPQKAVIGTHIETGAIIEFHSTMEAERQTGADNANISKCCIDKYNNKIAKNYYWKFKNNLKT